MRLGIDASNIPHNGGGATHLRQLLASANPIAHGVEKIIVWGGETILSSLVTRPWLQRHYVPILNSSLVRRQFWQRMQLPEIAARNCDVLFAPGGSFAKQQLPAVTMCRNMLPFEACESARYGYSWLRLRLWLLKYSQSKSFERADGLIFLTKYAQDTVTPQIGSLTGRQTIIPHGIDDRFCHPPRIQHSHSYYSPERPIKLLYVSFIGLYKHQWNVVEATALLRKEGVPIHLDLIGPVAQRSAMKRLLDTISREDPANEFISYHGEKPYTDLIEYYRNTDIFVFASSCENLSNIQLEAMAAGLPIACSNRASMPEVLGDAGVYFDPENPTDIANTINHLILDPNLRIELASRAYEKAFSYSWQRCASETMQFIAEISSS